MEHNPEESGNGKMGDHQGMTPPSFSLHEPPEGSIPISLKVGTYERLNNHRGEHESFNSLIKRILEEWETRGVNT